MLQVGSMSSALPICMEADSNFLDVLQDLQGSLPWLSLTPHCTNQSTPFMQSVVVRGIPETTPRRQRNIRVLFYLTNLDFCILNSVFPYVFKSLVSCQKRFSQSVKLKPKSLILLTFIGVIGLYTDLNAHNYVNFAKDISKSKMIILFKICQNQILYGNIWVVFL